MTIEEIKSVSIVQFLESQGYHHVYILKENYWYPSPFRTEASPSFNVSPKKNTLFQVKKMLVIKICVQIKQLSSSTQMQKSKLEVMNTLASSLSKTC